MSRIQIKDIKMAREITSAEAREVAGGFFVMNSRGSGLFLDHPGTGGNVFLDHPGTGGYIAKDHPGPGGYIAKDHPGTGGRSL